MTRSKRRQLEEAVIDAARVYTAAIGQPFTLVGSALGQLVAAVATLNEHLSTDLNGRGSFGANSPDTSVASATLRTPRFGSIRARIVSEIQNVLHLAPDSHGLCDHELERRLKSKHTTTSSARNWLVNAGWLRDSGFRRKTEADFEAIVWTLTDAARSHLRGGT